MESRRSRAWRCAARQLDVDLPLQILVKHHAAPMFPAEFGRFRGGRVLVGAGQCDQIHRVGIAPVEILVESAIGGELFQQVAFAIEECLEFAGTRGAAPPLAQELHEQHLEKRSLRALTRSYSTKGEARKASISAAHRRRLAQLAGARAGREIFHAFNVEIEEILVEGAVRQVRTGVERAAIVDGVQRIERHEAGLELVGGEIHYFAAGR